MKADSQRSCLRHQTRHLLRARRGSMKAATAAFSVVLILSELVAPARAEPARVFGRAQEQASTTASTPAPATPATPPPPQATTSDPALAQLQAEVAELRAREARRDTLGSVPVQTGTALAPSDTWQPRVFSHRYFEIDRLSPMERRRYFELEGQNRRVAFPLVLTSISGVLTLFFSSLYFGSLNDTCSDGYDDYSCPLSPAVLAIATVPATGLAIGAVLLRKRLPRRREFNSLIQRGMTIRPVFAGTAARLEVTF